MKKGRILLIVGLIIILISPYIPRCFIQFLWDANFTDITVNGVMPTLAIVGVLLSVTGIMLIGKENNS